MGQMKRLIVRDIKRYFCEYCGIGRARKHHITSHILSHHKDEMEEEGVDEEEEIEGKSPNTCTECGVTFKKPAYLKQHMQSHRPYTCSIDDCRSSYRRKDHLTHHLLQHQGKLFKCPIEYCNSEFSLQGNMKRHLKEFHSDDQPPTDAKSQKQSVCQEVGCGKVFRFPSKLRRHENSHVKLDSLEALCSKPGCMKYFAKKNHSTSSKKIPSPSPLRTLISAIQSPEDLKPPLMNAIYFLLLEISLKEPFCQFNSSPLEVVFSDVHKLSDVLFEELDRRFKRFCSDLSEHSKSGTNMSAGVVEELILLLRCCMEMLNLLAWDQNLLLEKGRVLLFIVKVLISLDIIGDYESERSCVSFEKSVSRQCGGDDGCETSVTDVFAATLCFLEPSDLCRPFLCALLEVLADELLRSRSLRDYLMLVDSTCSKNEALFTCHSSHGDIGSVLEVVAAHFVLSVSDELAFDNFINSLVWQHHMGFRFLELSLTSAISLLLSPIMLSAPTMFQVHVISLVSEAIGIGMSSKNLMPDLRLMDWYLTAFERSVILYTRHMSSLQMDGHPIGSKASAYPSMLGRSHPNFDSYIQQATRNKINHVVSKSDDFWDSYLHNMLLGTKSDLMAGALLYMKESQHVFDELCRDEILSILDCIIVRAFSANVSDAVLYKKGETSSQDIYYLASILKLMSSSLVQANWCLRHSGSFGCLKTLENASSCKQYDFMVRVIRCFQQFNVCLPVQSFLSDMMKTHATRHKESKWMILHFSGLLSLSFNSGLNFLVKGCISMIMALMNLFAFEEGDLLALRPLLAARSEALSSKIFYAEGQEPLVDQKSSRRVASRFQKIQTLYLRSVHQTMQNEQVKNSQNVSILGQMKESIDGTEEETVETCDGKTFLNCVLDDSQQLSDYDDLADFIECKRGKDYSGWLNDRQKYRNRRCRKMAVLRWKKKRKTWKFIKRQKL